MPHLTSIVLPIIFERLEHLRENPSALGPQASLVNFGLLAHSPEGLALVMQ